jgi:hypothetical protein
MVEERCVSILSLCFGSFLAPSKSARSLFVRFCDVCQGRLYQLHQCVHSYAATVSNLFQCPLSTEPPAFLPRRRAIPAQSSPVGRMWKRRDIPGLRVGRQDCERFSLHTSGSSLGDGSKYGVLYEVSENRDIIWEMCIRDAAKHWRSKRGGLANASVSFGVAIFSAPAHCFRVRCEVIQVAGESCIGLL